ncbi:hypothetical protein F5Y18DRAFT_389525 [Xylariaceae sp. FL1019]|nr:hypothetical protein F5Y18DRAFT_389525 [Xylariaceae sp. FL1019]
MRINWRWLIFSSCDSAYPSATMLKLTSYAELLLGLFIFEAASQEYDYVVVGSGPGGGPLAVDLAKTGSTVLLLEAGSDLLDDPTYDELYGDPKTTSRATNNAASRWDFFVKHSDDSARESEYEHMTWRTGNGSLYVGESPPNGSEQLGIWYPRAATLGGGALIDDAVLELPSDDTWEYIANITGDESWRASEMRKIYEEIEHCNYEQDGTNGHGFTGWLETNRGNDSWLGADMDATALFRAMAEQAGTSSNMSATELEGQLSRDINAADADRDASTGVFGTVTHTDAQGRRISPANYIRQALADDPELPLFVELNSYLTSIAWDPLQGAGPPAVMGVNYVVGSSAYKADPRYDSSRNTTTSFSYVAKELIIAGGALNTPQILKVSGIGPADELNRHNITLMADLPGVGANLGDVPQGSVVSQAAKNVDTVGSYSIQLKSSISPGDRDVVLWPVAQDFEGYWPGYPSNQNGSDFTIAFALKNAHSSTGTVTLRSANPLDVPDINFRFFEDNADADLEAMLEAWEFVGDMKARVPAASGLTPMTELHPCPSSSQPCTADGIKNTLKTQAYSRHATGTCAMGNTETDPMAVVDSRFRVKGVERLRVVDASVFPKPPGAFPILPTFMISRKAAKVILEDRIG